MKKYFSLLAILLSFTSLKARVFQEWAQRYNGPDSLGDMGTAVDVNGNVYVTGVTQGSSMITLKYNPAGMLQWTVISSEGNTIPVSIAVDQHCNVYVAGIFKSIGANHYFTLKYNSDGIQQWEARYGPLNSSDYLSGMAIDAASSVYITGTSEGQSNTTTLKYDSSGVQQWATKFNYGLANAIAIDTNHNVYVTGLGTASADYDYVTLKYNPAGAQQWVRIYDGPGNSLDEALDIALDKNGNVYVTGQSIGAGTGLDVATVKYMSNGAQEWVARYDGPIHQDDICVDIDTDSRGNIIVTGKSASGVDTTFCRRECRTIHDMLTIQYSKDGAVKWIQTYDGPAHEEDFATALALDNRDNVYITGASTGIGTGLDYATIKYTSKGKLEWTQRYNDSANGYDQANAIALDSASNVYVTGLSSGSGTNDDIATVKYAHTISLNYSNAELELQYNGSVTDKGMLSLNLVVRDTNNNIIIATDMKIDVTSFAYRLDVNKPLIKESKKLVKIITQEKAVSIENVLTGLIDEYSSNHDISDFRNEQLEGIFYYRSVFKSIDRYYSDILTNDNAKIEITNYNGYIVGLSSYVPKEDIIVNVADFTTYLQSRGTQDDVNYVVGKLTGYSSINMKDYELLVNGFLSNTSTFPPEPDPPLSYIPCFWLCGTDCGCCGNYEGHCYYASWLCYWHDYICQQCDVYIDGHNICGHACEPTPCNPL